MLNEVIVILAALAISILIVCWVLKLIKLSITTALTVFAIIIVLKFGFGIDSTMVWQAIINIPQTIYTLINN